MCRRSSCEKLFCTSGEACTSVLLVVVCEKCSNRCRQPPAPDVLYTGLFKWTPARPRAGRPHARRCVSCNTCHVRQATLRTDMSRTAARHPPANRNWHPPLGPWQTDVQKGCSNTALNLRRRHTADRISYGEVAVPQKSGHLWTTALLSFSRIEPIPTQVYGPCARLLPRTKTESAATPLATPLRPRHAEMRQRRKLS